MADKSSPAIGYRICVEGVLDPSWSESLGGLSISIDQKGDEPRISILTGLLNDQVALQGVLNTLFLLNLPLLGVERYTADS